MKGRKKKFKVLVTGDENYSNKMKLFKYLDQFNTKIQQQLQLPVQYATFNRQYGAQKLCFKYAMKRQIPIKYHNSSDIAVQNKARAYYVNLNKAVNDSDFILVFSNIYTKQIRQIIRIAKSKNKNYAIIKEK